MSALRQEASSNHNGIAIANAPVSFGVFELTTGTDAHLPSVEQVIDAVAAPGYEGIDLGPLGFLGVGACLRDRLARRGLGLAGGWVQMRFLEPDAFREDLDGLRAALETFRAGTFDDHPPPRPTLADAGSPQRRAAPGHAGRSPDLSLSPGDWERLWEGVGRAARVCRDAGLEPTFHHHAGTHVESVEEVEMLLQGTDVGLCLDTGHLLIGGGDPLETLDAWRQRINHVHIKDVDKALLGRMVSRRASMYEIWEAGVFRRFGTGGIDVPGFTNSLAAGGYRGWIVVEQDRILKPVDRFEAIVEEQAGNLSYLRSLGL